MPGIPRYNRPSGSPPPDAEPGCRYPSRPTSGPPDLHPADPGSSPDEVTPPQVELSRVLRELLGDLPIGSLARPVDPPTPTDRVRQDAPLGPDRSSEAAGRGDTGTPDGPASATGDAGPAFADARSSFPPDPSRETIRQGFGVDPTDATSIALTSTPRAITEERTAPRLPEDRGLIDQRNIDPRSDGPVGERRMTASVSSTSLARSSTGVAVDDEGAIRGDGIAATSGDLLAVTALPATVPSSASPFPPVSGRVDDRGFASGLTSAAVAIGGAIGPRDDPTEGPEGRPMAASAWVAPSIGAGPDSSGPAGPDLARTNALLEQILDALRRQAQPPFLGGARAVYPER